MTRIFLLCTNLTALHAQRRHTKSMVLCEMQLVLTPHTCTMWRACMRSTLLGRLCVLTTRWMRCTSRMSAHGWPRMHGSKVA